MAVDHAAYGHQPRIALIGAPVGAGAANPETRLGPAALRSNRLADALRRCGCEVADHGDVTPDLAALESVSLRGHAHHVATVAGWARSLSKVAYRHMCAGGTPVFLGGDHSLAMGTVTGVARYWAEAGRELFLLWLDAHADYNTPTTSPSGNMHGMALAMLTGEDGFDPLLGDRPGRTVRPENVFVVGARSLDPDEAGLFRHSGALLTDMRELSEFGVRLPLQRMLELVALRGGVLHVSLDVDVLDPAIAPGVGTPVAGGMTSGQAHLIMQMLHESGLVGSLDVAELNPALDIDGQSARVVVGLIASLFGVDFAVRRVSSIPENSHGKHAA